MEKSTIQKHNLETTKQIYTEEMHTIGSHLTLIVSIKLNKMFARLHAICTNCRYHALEATKLSEYTAHTHLTCVRNLSNLCFRILTNKPAFEVSQKKKQF